MTPAGQRWTREKPTEPGWYWWRDEGLYNGIKILQLSLVMSDLQVHEHGMLNGLLVRELPGEWQGPLTPNEATE